MLEKIKEFIAYAQKKKVEIEESFERYKSKNIFDERPYFISLQEQINKKGREVGVLNIDTDLKGRIRVLLKYETFRKLEFKVSEEKESIDRGNENIKWIHYEAVVDDIVYVTCRKEDQMDV